ncbi:GHKL domain-containing protein [Paenibacillus anaericanus]|uniref:histidine kinase n=1 Tax=Paenibacillus anaericanus TaxID=170367 RepID=A0A3S1K972_9BACL|nr:sensor histidine kinase [Paenibacillus anaericanus]RUT46731.1 GHKL domain-containing protein [Paenibacillus anaericanus]
MKVIYKGMVILVALFIIVFSAVFFEGYHNENSDDITIDHWKYTWTNQLDFQSNKEQLISSDGWIDGGTSSTISERTSKSNSQWIKFQLPLLKDNSSAILFDKIYGKRIIVNLEGTNVYESNRKYNYEINSILIPLSPKDSNKTIYIGIASERRIGIPDKIRIGEYQELNKGFVRGNISDFILGSALAFIALIMIVCSLFLKYENIAIWLSLFTVILSSGVIVLTYSSFSYWLFEDYGKLIVTLFDLSLFILLPAFTLFFEKTFGAGYYSLIQRCRKFQVAYSIFCVSLLLINELSSNKLFDLYSMASAKVLGYLMIIQFVLLVTTSIIYGIKGNKDAIIFSIGFMIFAFLGVGELVWFYTQAAYYDLFLWKWGVVSFLTSLIIILGRKFSENHERVVEYSKQLEVFNNELQRSEKMEIISELAASVAHEVRNPLQVTRGFIQLIAEKQERSDKVYLNMALEELDRASGIITDFLTFAKPEVGNVTTLDILEEFIHIEGILVPMANLQGGKITADIPNELYIVGNSSKFKQAFVNIIKNSIEALSDEGDIHLWAYEEKEQVCIHIKDNGEGMDEEVLARLGEPYFSNKTKGTGLGLMVTFRIIEVMNGKITFRSEKGIGTEVSIRFPAVKKS